MAATLDIRAPEDQTEGTRSQILRWLKAVGDTVTQHEPLIELETDKVTVEVPAPASGVLREIVKAEQEEIVPGEVLGRLETDAESAAGIGRAAGGVNVGDMALSDARGVGSTGGDSTASGSVGGDSVGGGSRRGDSNGRGLTGGGLTASGSVGGGWTGSGLGNDARPNSAFAASDARAVSSASPGLSPAVRRLMQERGLDASMIRGTGEGGRITVDDVAAFDADKQADDKVPTLPARQADDKGPTARAEQGSTEERGSTAAALEPRVARQPPPHSTAHAPTAPAGTRSHTVPHTAVRKRIAAHMVQSLLQTAPHVTTVFEADLTAVMAHRTAHRAEFQDRGVPLTFTAYFLAAIVDAIKAVPEANSRWTDTALEIYDDIHIGVATAVDGVGLVVPVVRNVESLDLFGIASRLDQLVTAAREGRLEPSDVRGGTFTISNHGVSGSLLATPIVINQPQSAILGVGKVEKRAVVIEAGDEQKIVACPKCYVTLTIDHRVMDGHQANRFLQTFVRTLESWPRAA